MGISPSHLVFLLWLGNGICSVSLSSLQVKYPHSAHNKRTAKCREPASFVLLSSGSVPVLPLRLYCLSITCPLGLPRSAPARMLQGNSSQTFSVPPSPHIQSPHFSALPWSTPVPVQQSHMAWPLHHGSALVRVPYLPRPVQHHLAMLPSGLE